MLDRRTRDALDVCHDARVAAPRERVGDAGAPHAAGAADAVRDSSGSSGTSYEMTCVTCEMSRPRAATFVATSSLARSERNFSITPSRWPWVMPPCSALTSTPRPLSWRTSSSTPTLRLRKTMHEAGRSTRIRSQSASSFSFGSTSTTSWRIVSTVIVLLSILTISGSYR